MAGFGTLRPVLDGTEQIPGSFAEQPRALPLPVQRTTPGTLRSIAGYIGDALAQSAGMHPVFAAAMERHQAQEDAVRQGVLAQQLEQANAASNRTAEHDEWQARQEWEATHRPEPPAIAIARAAGLTEGSPEWRSALTAAIPGYGYTAPVMQARTDGQKEVAGYRADRAAATRAQPTYAQLHPAPHAAPRPPKPPAGFILD